VISGRGVRGEAELSSSGMEPEFRMMQELKWLT
jgi:hypothetical protein